VYTKEDLKEMARCQQEFKNSEFIDCFHIWKLKRKTTEEDEYLSDELSE